jgi:FAD/FMN-containing dehydrogenase
MPRSIREILDHADQLADRFEAYEADPKDERPVEEHLLERAAVARADGERQVADAVIAARRANIPWQRIGELLGTSAQAAQQRYGAVVRSA